jgi:cytochrome c biogenesis protein CcmG/thiol:disulfide interchange protein DsbE
MRTLLLMTMLMLACPWAPARADVDIGSPAPALIATRLDGETFDLSAMKGKVVIINFWASWCPSCQAEMSTFRRAYTHYHKHGLEVIGISMDKPRLREGIKMLTQEYFFPAAMWSDVKLNGFAPPRALPTTYIIDANGIVRIITNDSITSSVIENIIVPLLPPEQEKL